MANFIEDHKITGSGSYKPVNIPNGRGYAERKRPFTSVLILDQFTAPDSTSIDARAPNIDKEGGGMVYNRRDSEYFKQSSQQRIRV